MAAVVTWNVNGLERRWAEVEALIRERRPGVLCLQETKSMRAPQVSGYDCWISPYPTKKGHHGVAIYAAGELYGAPVWFGGALEGRVLGVALGNGALVISVYSQNSDGKDEERHGYDAELFSELERVAGNWGGDLYIAGDLNACLSELDDYSGKLDPRKAGRKPYERQGVLRLMESMRLRDLYAEIGRGCRYTFWSQRMRGTREASERYPNGMGLRLDYILARAGEGGGLGQCWGGLSSCFVARWGTSDHDPLVAHL